jgi:hypothetical protein
MNGTAGATVSTVHVALVAALVFPTASTPLTWKVWLPAARLLYACGLVHGANTEPSRLHVKVTPLCESVNESEAVVWFVGLLGALVIVGAGGAAVVTVQLYDVAALVLPATSVARTRKVWLPSARPLYACGLVQVANAAASRLQLNVTLLSLSFKEKLAVVWLVGLAGWLVMAGAGGGVVSIVHVQLVAALVLPAASLAFTWKVWLPSARLLYACGLVQAANAAPSRLHVNVTPLSVSVKASDALVCVVGAPGPLVTSGGGGAVVSIVQVELVAVPVLPAASVALTLNVWLPSARLLYACGLVQAAKADPSRLQLKVAVESVSVKEKLALVWFVGFAGFAVIVGAGGAVESTVHVALAGALWFPSVSREATRNVCEPSARAL